MRKRRAERGEPEGWMVRHLQVHGTLTIDSPEAAPLEVLAALMLEREGAVRIETEAPAAGGGPNSPAMFVAWTGEGMFGRPGEWALSRMREGLACEYRRPGGPDGSRRCYALREGTLHCGVRRPTEDHAMLEPVRREDAGDHLAALVADEGWFEVRDAPVRLRPLRVDM